MASFFFNLLGKPKRKTSENTQEVPLTEQKSSKKLEKDDIKPEKDKKKKRLSRKASIRSLESGYGSIAKRNSQRRRKKTAIRNTWSNSDNNNPDRSDKEEEEIEAVKKEERRSAEHRKEQDMSSESEEVSSDIEEARRLLQTLSMRGPAVPCDLHSEIKILLRKKQIQSYQMYHEPGYIYKIVIHGTKVKSIQTDLDDLLRSRLDFMKFSITTSDIQEKETGFSNTWIHRLSPKPCILTRDGNEKVSTIEIVLTASDKKRHRRDVTDLYAATTAHTFMSEKEISSASPGHDFSSSFEEISKDTWLNRPFVLAPNSRTSVDIIERPLPVYKYQYRADQHDDTFLVYDMAMFKIDSTQFEDMISAETHHPHVRESVNQVVEGLVSIESGIELQQYQGRRIVCGGKTGVVQPQCEEETNGWVHGALISFTLDNGKTLEEGDCGLVVYLKDTVDETKLHRYGMLIGRLTRKPKIYIAMAISFGLRKMEEVDELKVVNIQVSESSSYENFKPLNNNLKIPNANGCNTSSISTAV